MFTERHGLRDPQKVELLQMKIISSLRDHVTYNPEAQRKPHYFSRLLSKLPELRSLSIQGLQRIFYLKVEDLAPAPPLLEAIFSSSLPFWFGCRPTNRRHVWSKMTDATVLHFNIYTWEIFYVASHLIQLVTCCFLGL